MTRVEFSCGQALTPTCRFPPVTCTSDRSTTRASLDADEGLCYKRRTMATGHVSLITKEEAVGVVGTHRMALGAPGGREQG